MIWTIKRPISSKEPKFLLPAYFLQRDITFLSTFANLNRGHTASNKAQDLDKVTKIYWKNAPKASKRAQKVKKRPITA